VPDVSAFANRLRKNAAHWRKWARRRGISCFRLYDRDIPQFPFAVDWYQAVQPPDEAHLHLQEIDTGWKMAPDAHAAWLAAACAAASEACGVPAARLHLKRRERQRGDAQYGKTGAAPQAFVVEEAGCRFEVDLDSYLDAGLFLDHRPLRARVAETIARRAAAGAGTRLLNLFAYTGSFTVHAARAGASGSTTVDLSNTYLAWAARNFKLNGIDPRRHRLLRADVLAWLPEALAAGERYDLIVLDPPSFSNSKKMQGVLDVQRDHARLVGQCHELLAESGELYFSTNLRSFAMDTELAQRLRLRDITSGSVPEDFRRPGKPPHRAWYAKK
jgi:23S rRNA (cytosine1962-C5)-methyltransferase